MSAFGDKADIEIQERHVRFWPKADIETSTMGLQIEVVRARDIAGIDAAFALLVRNKTDALVVGADRHGPGVFQ